ncbi:polysaccharide biosynthesis/export family protein [Sphingopyxis fribergensis]
MFSTRRETSGSLCNALVWKGFGVIMCAGLAFQTPAVAQQEAAANVAAEASGHSQYRVNAGDELDVFVWGEERMQRAVRVQPDGTFSFPLAGTVQASGRNVSDIAAEIRERISVNYRSSIPDVTVSVREATGMRFYVVGKVRTPGSYTSGNPVNILQALSVAGGTAEFADIKNAVILRQTPNGQVVEPVQLSTILKGGRVMNAGVLSSPLPMLLSGDVLVIP